MAWARFDDRYDDHPKVMAALAVNPLAAALHAQAITASARRESDGLVDPFWLVAKVQSKARRTAAVKVLVELRLFDRLPAGEAATFTDLHEFVVTLGPFDDERLLVHDFLKYNPSSAYQVDKRHRDADRKARGRRAQSQRSPQDVRADTTRTPDGVQAESNGPVPSRPVPTPSAVDSPPSAGDGASAPEGLLSIADEVTGILQRGIDGLTTDERCKRPSSPRIAALLSEHNVDPMTARAVAVDVRSVAQSQNRAPNIEALYASRLRQAAGMGSEAA